jgi:hypothetical protein
VTPIEDPPRPPLRGSVPMNLGPLRPDATAAEIARAIAPSRAVQTNAAVMSLELRRAAAAEAARLAATPPGRCPGCRRRRWDCRCTGGASPPG